MKGVIAFSICVAIINLMQHSKLAARFAKIIRKHGAVSSERLSHLTRVPVALVNDIMYYEMGRTHMLTHADLWTWR